MSTSSYPRESARAAERFRCRRHEVGAGVVRVCVVGELDRAGAVALEQVLRSACSDRGATVLDLDELTCIDIAGARTLRAAAGQACQHGRRLIATRSGEAAASDGSRSATQTRQRAHELDGSTSRHARGETAGTPCAPISSACRPVGRRRTELRATRGRSTTPAARVCMPGVPRRRPRHAREATAAAPLR